MWGDMQNSGQMGPLMQLLAVRRAVAPPGQFGTTALANPSIGLTGFDPRILNDPRFDVSRGVTPKGIPFLESKGESATTTMDPRITVKYLADVDDRTLADDMWAVTAGGHSGTSQEDRASPWFMRNASDIVGNATTITPAMIKAMRERLLAQRYGEIRQTHPGKGGYTPQGLRF